MDLRAVLLTGLLVTALSGCGSEPTEDAEVSDPSTSPAATETAAPVEFRVVLATDTELAPDSEVLQQFEGLDCEAEPVPAPPEEPLPACDDEGTKYVLEPASIVGGVESATATLSPTVGAGVVEVDLDPEATATFGELSADLAGTMRQFAIVLDGRVLSAPTIETPILDGKLQISGDFTQETAEALAERLAG